MVVNRGAGGAASGAPPHTAQRKRVRSDPVRKPGRHRRTFAGDRPDLGPWTPAVDRGLSDPACRVCPQIPPRKRRARWTESIAREVRQGGTDAGVRVTAKTMPCPRCGPRTHPGRRKKVPRARTRSRLRARLPRQVRHREDGGAAGRSARGRNSSSRTGMPDRRGKFADVHPGRLRRNLPCDA